MKWENNASTNDFSLTIGRRSFPTMIHFARMVSSCLPTFYFTLVEVPVGPDDLPPFEAPVYLFSREPHDIPYAFTNIFSVPSQNQRSLRSRAFVTHNGQDSGSGVWSCSKDPTSNCSHITTARHFLQKLIQVDPTAQDRSILNAPLEYAGNFTLLFHHAEHDIRLYCPSTCLSSRCKT